LLCGRGLTQVLWGVVLLLQILHQGCSVSCCDYDGRSGLMLAASKGHSLAAKLLLLSGADANAQDRMGSNALLEAVKAGHDEVIE
jgi:ankyrin repeat protein